MAKSRSIHGLHLVEEQALRPDQTSDERVTALEAEVARLRRMLEDAGEDAERGMALLAHADQEHVRLVERLKRSQRDLTVLSQTIPQLVWRSHDDGQWTWGSTQWTAYTGQSDVQSQGRGWLQVVHPEDRACTMQAWHVAAAKDGLSIEHRLRRSSDGAYRWFQTRATPLHDEAGRIVEWFGTSTEVHELKALQEQQGLFLAELQHRVRNTLAVMRLLARRTGEASESVEDFMAHLDARFGVFSRVQGAVTRDPSMGISLHSLVADELVAHGLKEGRRTQIAGPVILLQAKAAETLGLAIHELMTNAIKHGALSRPRGRIHIEWAIELDADAGAEVAQLCFVWTEAGMKNLPASPPRRGFGLVLLERTLCYDLQAETTVAFTPTGLCCNIRVPLSDVSYRDPLSE